MKKLEIQRPDIPGRIETVECRQRLREIPKSREVYTAVWEQEPVIVKLFFRPFQAKRHVVREWNRLAEIHKRDLPAPEPLFCGKTLHNHWVLVTRQVDEADNVLTMLESCHSADDQEAAANLLLQYLVQMHKAGVIQHDLHPGNFLFSKGQILALDPAQMEFENQPISREASLRNLVTLFCSLPERDWSRADSFLQTYLAARGWNPDAMDSVLFHKHLQKHKKRLLKKSLRKTMRNCSRFFSLKIPGIRGMFRRDQWTPESARNLAVTIDTLMESGRFLKQGNTCTVSRVLLHGRDTVIKRYNPKGLLHAVRHTLKGSRARRCWRNGYRLHYAEIPTAVPTAFLEAVKGGIVQKSYLLSEWIEGRQLDHYLSDPDRSEQQKKQILSTIDSLLETLCGQNLSHNDLKPSNILIRDEQPVLIDLDSMKTHWFSSIAGWSGRRMIRKFRDRIKTSSSQ